MLNEQQAIAPEIHGPRQRWDMFAFRDAVAKVRGEETSKLVYRFAVSLSKRVAFAKYHHSEVHRLIADELADMDSGTAAMFVWNLQSKAPDAPDRYPVLSSEAALTAFFQCLHPIEDYLAHTIYYSLDFDATAKTRLKPRYIDFFNVMERLRAGGLRDRVLAMREDKELQYVREFTNHTKHNNTINVDVEVSFEERKHGLRIGGFSHHSAPQLSCWAVPRLEAAFYAMQNHAFGIAFQLHRDLNALSA